MGRRRRKYKRLTGEQVQFVLRLLAEWTPLHEIGSSFCEVFAGEITHNQIQHYRDHPKWRPEIERLRTALVNRISDIPIASKFWRLRARQRLFDAENRYRIVRYAGVRRVIRQPDGSVVEEPIAIEELPLGEVRQLLLDSAKETGDLSEKRELTGRLTLEQLVTAATDDPESPGE